ncbi:MAG: hypothetical protein MI922_08630, partial [Bacteroidales bacterium]|nr:hypothetical protein [Bacteroidales bacterium]
MKKIILNLAIAAMMLPTCVFSQTVPYTKGRIVISSDGNEHDKDDWAATPFSLALLASQGLQNKLTVYTFSDHIWGSNVHCPPNSGSTKIGALEEMRESAWGGKKHFGFSTTKFIEAVSKPNQAYNAIRNEILKSNA